MRVFLNSFVKASRNHSRSSVLCFGVVSFVVIGGSLLTERLAQAGPRLPSIIEGGDLTLTSPEALSGIDAGDAPARPLYHAQLQGLVGKGTELAQNSSTRPPSASSPAPATGATPQQIGEKPDSPTAQEVFLRDQQVLLKRGQLTAELGAFYSKNEQDELTLLPTVPLGTPTVPALARVEQDTFLSIYTLRYGLLNDLQIFGSAPLFNQTDTLTIGSTAGVGGPRRSRTATRWGNVSVGLRYGLLAQGPGYPEVIPSVVGQVPTGRNSASVGGGVALVKSLDPAALFASFNYRRVLRDGRFVNLTRRLPEAENNVDVTIGYAFALNDTLTLNASVNGFFSDRTEFETIIPPSTARVAGLLASQEQISLQLGFTSLLAKNLYVEPSVSFGVTGRGSSAVVGLSIPYTFEF